MLITASDKINVLLGSTVLQVNVGPEGLEPSRCYHQRILSPLRLPIPPWPRDWRCLPGSNRRSQSCSLLPYHLAKAPTLPQCFIIIRSHDGNCNRKNLCFPFRQLNGISSQHLTSRASAFSHRRSFRISSSCPLPRRSLASFTLTPCLSATFRYSSSIS